jgi:hypothetical protein
MAGKVNLLGPLYSDGAGDSLGSTKVEGPNGGKSPKDALGLIHAKGVSKSSEDRKPHLSKE